VKVSYIVNVDLNDKQARSVQITSNAKVFHEYLGESFKCIAIGRREAPFSSLWVNNINRESSKLRKFLFHIQSVKFILSSEIVYSRNLSVLYLVNLFGKKIVWEMHDGVKGFMNQFLLNKLKRKLKIVAVSEAQVSYVAHNFGIAKDKFLVASNGVFVEKYDELRNIDKEVLREELNLPLDKTIVMHTGSLYKGRGAELFEVIIKNFPDLYFVQVGGTECNINEWESNYQDYRNITFIGHQNSEKLVKYQMSADLLFLPMTKSSPIWWCTSPMKMFEYMATGVPILGSNVGSVGEILTNKNAIIFDPSDNQTILDGIDFFVNHKNEAQLLAQESLKNTIENYSWKRRIDKVCRFML
jgi:glycosyltransferase involved in cell wall biosynthesis